MSSTVKDVMSTHVIAVKPGATYKVMAAMLHDQRVSAFPVVDDEDRVIGMVSETDLLAKEALAGTVPQTPQSLQERLRSQVNGVTAADLMTKPAVTIGPDEAVARAARVMFDRQVKRLPVVSDDGKLIGILSRSDVLRVYSRPDAEIARQVSRDLIMGTFACDPADFAVTVEDGIVTIAGKPESVQIGLDIIDAIRRMEGIVAVRDRLTYPPNLTVPPQ